MNKFTAYIQEALDTKVPYTVTKSRDDTWAATAIIDGKKIVFEAHTDEGTNWDCVFYFSEGKKQSFGLTGDGIEFQTFAFVKAAFEEFLHIYRPETAELTADKDSGRNNRAALYDRMFKRFAQASGYKVEKQNLRDSSVRFLLTRH